jgi:hypothetical protein
MASRCPNVNDFYSDAILATDNGMYLQIRHIAAGTTMEIREFGCRLSNGVAALPWAEEALLPYNRIRSISSSVSVSLLRCTDEDRRLRFAAFLRMNPMHRDRSQR